MDLLIFDLDETLISNNGIDQEVKAILCTLASKNVEMAIASRNDQYVALDKLCENGIREYFSFVVADFRPKGFQVRDILNKYVKKNIKFGRIFFIDDAEHNVADVKKRVPEVQCLLFGHDIANLGEIIERME